MPATHSLPENPRLDQLRQRARNLQRAARAGDPDAIARVHNQRADADPTTLALSTAQLVVAREHGFASWPRLRRYLELVAEHAWHPTSPPAESRADEFCRLACLTYQDDGPDRWARARELRADHPELTSDHIWAAAAAAEPATVRQLLTAEPGLARRRGGPHRWTPLFYLAYSRLDLEVPAEPVLAMARLLLDAGADPDEGYLWHGRPYPFTLLTGVFGEGEGGPEQQPRHPHSLALARLLLDAGANPNDSQALYNRMFRPDNDHLELLLAYGLGTGDTYPWRDRLGDLLDSPPQLLRVQLGWAIEHGFLDRVRLLVRHGVDFHSPHQSAPDEVAWLPEDGRTPAELAALQGHAAIVDFLVSQGAAPPALDPAGALVAAAFSGDRTAVARLRTAHPEAADQVRRERPGLLVWAAANGRTGTVRLLAELGLDINALGRQDAPASGAWETALHTAAGQGNLDLARLLLSLDADPTIRDCRFGATPLGWAQHFGQDAMVELLTPLSPED